MNTAVVKCEINMINFNNDTIKELAQFPSNSIGGNTFIYWRGISNNNHYDSIWFFIFYSSTMFYVKTKGM